jgi:hypothetical protein
MKTRKTRRSYTKISRRRKGNERGKGGWRREGTKDQERGGNKVEGRGTKRV